ncbi:hypothetical protein COB64_03390 [Candidatus Wolfebacteria bacterium]|nr:MAG: hypothetical protein COB64_03390 [Candidatus Wolfebacteria bacterium]
MDLDSKIEALLFYKGEPMSFKKLSDYLKVKPAEIVEALSVLQDKLEGRGLSLVIKEQKVMLGTNSEMGSLLESMRKEELTKELSKASLETLSVILYKNGVARGEIDYIRGVNSSFILRSLLVRGLIERVTHATDSRKYIYKPSFDLLTHLGITRIDDLPEYSTIKESLEEEINTQEEEDIN